MQSNLKCFQMKGFTVFDTVVVCLRACPALYGGLIELSYKTRLKHICIVGLNLNMYYILCSAVV